MYRSFLVIGGVLDFFFWCLQGHFILFYFLIFNLWGYFGHIQVIEGILVFFRHGGTLVVFDVLGVYFDHFLGFWGYFSHFLDFKGVYVFF